MSKIVSGGQTGADRAALDAALAAEFSCGGWCPDGRLAEDGVIPAEYPLTELPHGGYADRTLKNVEDSDGTLIIYFGRLLGGTEMTRRFCAESEKPLLAVNAQDTSWEQAAELGSKFVGEHKIKTLNVAGPRATQNPEVYEYTLNLIGNLIKDS